MERTLVLIKPDAMKRKLMGRIITIYEEKGLTISAIKILKPSLEIAERHYAEHKGKPFYTGLIDFITGGEVCAMVIEGENAVSVVRKINGATNPMNAETGTIRGQFALSVSENAVHSSDSEESALRELNIWFPEL
jgi:nucleoside-diphosphate kinase